MRRQRLNQRSISVRVVAVQIDVFDAGPEFRKRKVENSAQCEIIFNFRALLGPLHVYGFSVHLSWYVVRRLRNQALEYRL